MRRAMSLKDPSMLYAIDNLDIDSFLDKKTPNLYNISGTDLYAKAAAASKAASGRMYHSGDRGSTLGGYYREYVEQMGYTPEQLRQFGDQISADFAARVSALPELQDAANQILEANGVNENLTGNNLMKARQQVIRGLIDGAIYQEKVNPVRDPGVMSAAERAADARAQAHLQLQQDQFSLSTASSGWEKVDGQWRYNIYKDPKHATDAWMYKVDEATGRITGMSPEYEEAVKKGLLPKNAKPAGMTMGRSGSTPATKKNNPVNLKPTHKYNKKGERITLGSSANQNIGMRIPYEEAVEKYPVVAEYDPDTYVFYESGNELYPIYVGTSGETASTDSVTSHVPEDGNQLIMN